MLTAQATKWLNDPGGAACERKWCVPRQTLRGFYADVARALELESR